MRKKKWRLSQIFEDQTEALDEKRIMGVVLIVAGIVYFFVRPASSEVMYVGSAMIIAGLACFGVSIGSDKIAAGMSKIASITDPGTQNESDSAPQ